MKIKVFYVNKMFVNAISIEAIVEAMLPTANYTCLT